MRILIIDADADTRDVVRCMLGGTGFGLVEAADGWDGLRLFRGLGAALILCDVSATGPNGLELLRVLRREDPGVKVVLTAHGGHASGMNLLPAGWRLGAAGLLLKPFRREELLDAIARAGLTPPCPPPALANPHGPR